MKRKVKNLLPQISGTENMIKNIMMILILMILQIVIRRLENIEGSSKIMMIHVIPFLCHLAMILIKDFSDV